MAFENSVQGAPSQETQFHGARFPGTRFIGTQWSGVPMPAVAQNCKCLRVPRMNCSTSFSTSEGKKRAMRGAMAIIYYALFTASLLVIGCPSNATASPDSTNGIFELEIRTIRATDASTDGVRGGSIDSRIEDLRSQLEQLHYRNFKLLAAQRERVLPRKKTIFSLTDGHRLAVKPLYIDGDRVGVWMRWVDGDGAEILDTRMHLTCGESIVTGTDRDGGEGMVVAIRPSILTNGKSQ